MKQRIELFPIEPAKEGYERKQVFSLTCADCGQLSYTAFYPDTISINRFANAINQAFEFECVCKPCAESGDK